MPYIPTNIDTTQEEAFRKLTAHLLEEPQKEIRGMMQAYIKQDAAKKVARRQKTKLTGKGVSLGLNLPRAQLPEGAEIPVQGDTVQKRMFNQEIRYDQDKKKYIISYVYGRADWRGVFKGTKQEWEVSAKKKAIWKILDTDFARALSPISSASIKEKVGALASGIGEIDKSKRAILSYAAFAGTVGSTALMMNMYDQPNIAGFKPEVIVGAVPIYSVQYLERAKSDRKLKSRAIGDVFLAHQKGNKDILRIDLTLYGKFKYVYLWYFIALQRDGTAETQNVNLTGLPVKPSGSNNSQMENKAHKLLNYDVHRTFPIITKNHIILSMYLQTIEWHQSVQDGKNVIKVHLLFRKYLPTSAYKIFNPVVDTVTGETTGGSGLELIEKFGMAKRWMEFAVDSVWKMMRMHGELYGRMMIGDDGQEVHMIDQQAVSSMDKMITSYSGKLLGVL